jgi:hypothetical protein
MTVDKSKLQNSPFGASPTNAVNLRQTFNNTQNWTVPNTVSGIYVHLVGGGSGGGSRNTGGQTANGKGGTGGNGVFAYTPVVPGSTVGITIGAGGAGGTLRPNTDNLQEGEAGGLTYVNTSGASWVAGGGMKGATQNTTNTYNGFGYQGKIYGTSRQQIVFSDKANSGRINQLFSVKEGAGFGGGQDEWAYNGSNANSQNSERIGQDSRYGGGSGGGAVTNSNLGGNGATGGNQIATGRTGGAGAAWVTVNSGGGGGGAGIAGNGGAASGTNGGAGGAGGGGGGGGGAANANTGCTGGAGGAGAVLIYY